MSVGLWRQGFLLVVPLVLVFWGSPAAELGCSFSYAPASVIADRFHCSSWHSNSSYTELRSSNSYTVGHKKRYTWN